jgi:peptidyl-prolyl cis-trans isomerase B (cyclophilin B)
MSAVQSGEYSGKARQQKSGGIININCEVTKMKKLLLILMGGLFMTMASNADAATTYVILETNYGDIKLELDGDKAPVTVENFVNYVKNGHYDGTLFHRVIPGFMIQGGGLTRDFVEKETSAPIINEAANGLKNRRGAIAMARTNDPNSATSQFFINLVDNDFLDYKNPAPQGIGYAVFGHVVEGMDVVDKIAGVRTIGFKGHQDVPAKHVVINKATVSFDKK